MALRNTLRNCLPHRYKAAHTLRRTFTSSDCGPPKEPPACPPCDPQPTPPCRNKIPRNQYDLQVFCRPPPGSHPPPCPSPEAANSRDCTNSVSGEKKSYQKLRMEKKKCDELGVRDIVQQRHREAKEKRRQSYLEDVEKRKLETKCANEAERALHQKEAYNHEQDHHKNKELPAPAPVPNGIWASDGRAYHQNETGTPKLVQLESNPDRCIPHTGQHLKPCNDLPNPRLSIIRDKPTSSKDNKNVDEQCTQKKESLSSRFMKSFQNKKEANETTNHQNYKELNKSNEIYSLDSEATIKLNNTERLKKISLYNCKDNNSSNQPNSKHKDSDHSWCSNPPPNKAYTPKCVKPSLVERITKRNPALGEPSQRKFHTDTKYLANEKTILPSQVSKERNFVGHVQIKVTPSKENQSEIRLYMALDNDFFQQSGNTIDNKATLNNSSTSTILQKCSKEMSDNWMKKSNDKINNKSLQIKKKSTEENNKSLPNITKINDQNNSKHCNAKSNHSLPKLFSNTKCYKSDAKLGNNSNKNKLQHNECGSANQTKIACDENYQINKKSHRLINAQSSSICYKDKSDNKKIRWRNPFSNTSKSSTMKKSNENKISSSNIACNEFLPNISDNKCKTHNISDTMQNKIPIKTTDSNIKRVKIPEKAKNNKEELNKCSTKQTKNTCRYLMKQFGSSKNVDNTIPIEKKKNKALDPKADHIRKFSHINEDKNNCDGAFATFLQPEDFLDSSNCLSIDENELDFLEIPIGELIKIPTVQNIYFAKL